MGACRLSLKVLALACSEMKRKIPVGRDLASVPIHLPKQHMAGACFPAGGMGSKVERAQKGGNLTAKAKAPRAQGLLACCLCCRPPGRPVPRGNSCPSPRAHSPPGKPSLAPTRVSRVRYPAAPRSGRAVFYLVVLPQDWVGRSSRTPEEEAWPRPSHGKGRTGPLCGLCSRSNPAPPPQPPASVSLPSPPLQAAPSSLGDKGTSDRRRPSSDRFSSLQAGL